MKTINIKKDRNISDGIFVIVNGEKHLLRYQSLTPPPLSIQVPDNKPFEIRVKSRFSGSPAYIFEPKENILLCVSGNLRWINIAWGAMTVSMILVHAVGWLFRDGLFHYVSVILWLFTVILFLFIMRKKWFIINEVNIEGQ
jgi:hypothetical protein